MTKEYIEKKYILIAEICVFVLTFAVHVFFVSQMSAPQYVDEYRTFLTGEFLAGRDDLSLLHTFEESNMYYGFGQVLFYIPFFWIFDSIDSVFKAALILNGIVMSLIPVLSLKIFRMILPDYSEFQRSSLAVAIGMFSPFLYSSKTVTNETFLLFFPVLILYLLVVLIQNDSKKRKIIFSALLGITSMYMYTLNARGLAFTFSVFICVFFIEIIKKEKKIVLIPYVVSSVCMYGVNCFIKKYIIQSFHQPFTGTGIRNSDINFFERLKQYDIHGLFTALTSDWGNWFYVLVISGGIVAFLIGIVFIKKKDKFDKYIWMYPLTSTFVTYVMLFFVNYNAYSTPSKRLIDYYIYGRYYDLLIPVILIVGISYLIKYSGAKKVFWIAILVNVFTGVVASTGFANILIETGSSGIRVLNIGTLTAFLSDSFVNNPTYSHFIGISIVGLLIFIILYELAKKKKVIWMSLLICCCFLFATQYVMKSCKNASIAAKNNIDEMRTLFYEYENLDDEYKRVYYLYEKGTNRAVNMQYALRGWKVAQVDMKSDYNTDLNMLEENSFILVRNEFFLDVLDNDFKYIREENGAVLYAYGDDLISKLNLEEQKRENVSLLSLVKADETTSLIVSRGEQSYGPYINLEAGTYYVEIEGKNLESVQTMVLKNYAADIIDIAIQKQECDKIELVFSIETYAENIEIPVFNNDKEYIIIEHMKIIDENNKQVFEANGSNLPVTSPVYIYTIEDYEKLYLEPVILEEGKYLITIKGSNVDQLEMNCDELEECTLLLTEEHADYIKYELTCSNFIKYPSIRMSTSNGEFVMIEDVIIEAVNK